MNDQVVILCKRIPASNRIELTELLFNLFLCDKNALETVHKQTNKQTNKMAIKAIKGVCWWKENSYSFTCFLLSGNETRGELTWSHPTKI